MANPWAKKLTIEQVQQIIAIYQEPARQGRHSPPYKVVAYEYGVSAVMIHKIVRGKCWDRARCVAA